jgi:transcriptional regulator with XRE-family HTH domain
MSTADRIKRARRNAGLTQEELARRAGVSSITVSRWERGTQVPQLHQYLGIANATGADIDDLHAVEAIA